MLTASSEATLMAHFYELAEGCTTWYSGASQKYDSDVRDMKTTVSLIGAHKHVIMNYAKDEFHTVKGSIFNIVDSLIDVQRAISSVDTYFEGRIKYLTRRITADEWKYQLKYSTGVTKRCSSEHGRISGFEASIEKETADIAKRMGGVHTAFLAGAKRDLNKWNCNEMYPQPVEDDFGGPKWLGGITKFAEQGF